MDLKNFLIILLLAVIPFGLSEAATCKCSGTGNQYTCDDGAEGYCATGQECFNTGGFTKGQWDFGCRFNCRCTGEGNKFSCDDGSEGYCATSQECFNTDRFTKGEFSQGCRDLCSCTGESNKFTCTDGTVSYCATNQDCYNTGNWTKGTWTEGCRYVCQCTGEGNKYSCTDGSVGYCGSGELCYNSGEFSKDDWSKGCAATCQCTGEGNKYTCNDGTEGYCGVNQGCNNTAGFAKGQWDQACAYTCQCTGDGNKYTCSDGTEGYCASGQLCYNTDGFRKDQPCKGCKYSYEDDPCAEDTEGSISCKCTGESNKYSCDDGTQGYCSVDQECYNQVGFRKGEWCRGCQYPNEVAPCSKVPGPKCICDGEKKVKCDGDTWSRDCKDLLGNYFSDEVISKMKTDDSAECYATEAFQFQEWCKGCRPKDFQGDPCGATVCQCNTTGGGLGIFSCGTGSAMTMHSCFTELRADAKIFGNEEPDVAECYASGSWEKREQDPIYCNGCRAVGDNSPCEVNKKEMFDEDNVEWANEWDSDLDFECDEGQHISEIYSVFSGSRNDRRWSLKCATGFVSNVCSWTSLTVQGIDKETPNDLDESCPDNYVLSGLWSHHDNDWEDRIWKFKCCMVNSYQTSKDNCETHKLNNWGTTDHTKSNKIGYKVPDGKVITSVKGEKFGWKETGDANGNVDKEEEDRLWSIKVCALVSCETTSVNITGNTGAIPSENKLVAMGSIVGCSSNADYGFQMTKENTVTEYMTLTTGSSTSTEYGASVSITVGNKFIGSVTVEASVSHTGTISEESSKSVGTTSGSTAINLMGFTGPGVLVSWATMEQYDWNLSNVAAEFTGTCKSYHTDGTVAETWSFKSEGGVSLSARTFANTQYFMRSSDLGGDKTKCSDTLSNCVQDIEADNVTASDTAIDTQLKACLEEAGVSDTLVSRQIF